MMRNPWSKVIPVVAALQLVLVAAHGAEKESQPIDGENLKAQIEQLATLHRSGDLDRLIAETEKKAADSAASAEVHFEFGLLLAGRALFGEDIQQGKSYWNRAIRQLEKALEKSPKLAEAHSVLGHLYMCPFVEDKNALSKSREHFQRALEIKPGESVAQEGMRRLSLRSGSTEERRGYIETQLRHLTRATQSGRNFSVLSVKMEDSPLASEVLAEIRVQDVPDTAIIDSVQEMRRVGGLSGARGSQATSHQMVSSIIRMTSEASGVIYSAVRTLGLQAGRVGVILYGRASKRPLRRVLVPCSLLQKLMEGRHVSEREMFGGMIYVDESGDAR